MIKLVNISKFYHENNVVTLGLRKVNLNFENGEFVAITGESGSGKSTLLNVISGIDTYEDGELYINGQETSYYDENDWEEYRRNYIGFIFQNYNLIDSYTVLENVLAAMIIQGIPKKERLERAKKIIERVGLTSHIKHRATKLSGGQKQRLCIARTLAKDTKVIVADEPTGNLDSETGKQIMELLYEISKEKLVLMVTHNYEEAEQYVTRKIRLFDGEVVEDREIKPYTKVETTEEVKVYPQSAFKKTFTFSLYNLKNQPKRTTLLMLVTLAATFFVFLACMNFFITTKFLGTGMFLRSNSYYENNYAERVVVTKKDNSYFTDEELSSLENLKDVANIVKFDPILDISISMNHQGSYYRCLANSVKQITEADLTSGRLPNTYDEAVLVGTFTKQNMIALLNSKVSLDRCYLEEMTIVGLINSSDSSSLISNQLYVNDDFFTGYNKYSLEQDFLNRFYVTPSGYNRPLGGYYSFDLEIDSTLSENQFRIEASNDFNIIMDGDVTIYFDGEEVDSQNIVIGNFTSTVYVSQTLYDANINDNTKQITLNLKDADDALSVMNDLKSNYYVTSPYLSSTDLGAIVNIFTGIIGFISASINILVSYLVAYLVIKTILLNKKKDYTIFRTIGIDKKTIMNINKAEMFICFSASFIIVAIIFVILRSANIAYLNMLISVINLFDLVLIYIVNILISLLISHNFNKLLMSKSLLSNLKVE